MRGAKPLLKLGREQLGDLPPPNWFPEDARDEWNRVVPILTERRILTEADLGSLENYCLATGLVREMQRRIADEGAVITTHKLDKDGNAIVTGMRRNPAVGIQSDAMTRARLLAAELGLTPVSRSRPTVTEDEDGQGLLSGWEDS